jgi:hypothetical protein
MVKMTFPKGHGGASVAGAQYRPNKQGEVDVDEAHITEVMGHGGKLAGGDTAENERVFADMTVEDLRNAFANQFHQQAPRNARKAELINALEQGWDVFSIDELRESYKGRFNVDAPPELKKPDLIEALKSEE